MYSISALVFVFIIEMNSAILNLPEGSACSTASGEGTCTNFYKCPTLIDDMRHRRFPTTCSIDKETNTPIVCCDSCFTVENISNAVFVPTGALMWKNGNKSWDNCLEYSKYARGRCRVLSGVYNEWDPELNCTELVHYEMTAAGGRNAHRYEFPHMALLGYGESVESMQWLCGGSLISDRYILTAAHCTYPSTKLGAVSHAALGILKRSDPLSMWQTYGIAEYIDHPEYRPPVKYHDIALLRTNKPVVLSESVYPACLLPLSADSERELDFTATGWGALGHNQPLADTLQVIKVSAFSEARCSELYPANRLLTRGLHNQTQMCFGDPYGAADTCQGDSGGPLQVDLDSLCMYAVVGVTSYGLACGFEGQAGVYTRAAHYIPWIEDIVWN